MVSVAALSRGLLLLFFLHYLETYLKTEDNKHKYIVGFCLFNHYCIKFVYQV